MSVRLFSDLDQGFWLFGCPTRLYGCSTSSKARQVLDRLIGERTANRPIILTDAGVRKTSFFKQLFAQKSYPVWLLGEEGELGPMERVMEDRRARVADLIIAVGGGSVMDAAKCLAACLPSGMPPRDLLHTETPLTEVLPLICVPTTFGTGAEVNMYAHLALEGKKVSFQRPWLAPGQALLIGEAVLGLSQELRYFTALDAWVHAIEGLTLQRENSPFQSVLLRGALAFHERHFSSYLQQPSAEVALEMAAAATMGGLGIHNARTGLIHTLAGPFAAKAGLSHAASLWPFILPVLRYNREGLSTTFREDPEVLAERIAQKFVAPGEPFVAQWHLKLTRQDLSDMILSCRSDTVLAKENPVALSADCFEQLYLEALDPWF